MVRAIRHQPTWFRVDPFLPLPHLTPPPHVEMPTDSRVWGRRSCFSDRTDAHQRPHWTLACKEAAMARREGARLGSMMSPSLTALHWVCVHPAAMDHAVTLLAHARPAPHVMLTKACMMDNALRQCVNRLSDPSKRCINLHADI